MPLYLCISKLEGKPTDKWVMPAPSLSVINGGSLAGNPMACQEFMIVPTGASGSAEAMITGTEVYHTLKSSSRRSTGKMRAMSVTRDVLLRVCRTATKRWTSLWTLLRSLGTDGRRAKVPPSRQRDVSVAAVTNVQ